MWLAAETGADVAATAAIWTAFGVIGAAAVTGLLAIVQGLISRWRGSSAGPVTPSQPSPGDSAAVLEIARRQGSLVQRADDNDERDHVQDMELRDQRQVLDDHERRLKRLERRDDEGLT